MKWFNNGLARSCPRLRSTRSFVQRFYVSNSGPKQRWFKFFKYWLKSFMSKLLVKFSVERDKIYTLFCAIACLCYAVFQVHRREIGCIVKFVVLSIVKCLLPSVQVHKLLAAWTNLLKIFSQSIFAGRLCKDKNFLCAFLYSMNILRSKSQSRFYEWQMVTF